MNGKEFLAACEQVRAELAAKGISVRFCNRCRSLFEVTEEPHDCDADDEIGVECRRETVGEDAGDYYYRWLCSHCCLTGRWTQREETATRGMRSHRARHREARRADQGGVK